MLYLGKKGVSEMVGYVLLVVIGISLAVIVYGFLKVYIPPQKASCPNDVSLSIEELSCGNGVISIALRNRGLFSVDGAYIRVGEPTRVFRTILNDENILFPEYYPDGLPPDSLWPGNGKKVYPYAEMGSRVVEIEPVIFIDNERVLCDNALITQEIICSDQTNPLTITLSSPIDGGQYAEGVSIPLTFVVTGDNKDKCWYTLDNGITNASLPGCSSSSLDGLVSNSYIIKIYLNDSNGEETSDSASFTVTPQGLIINIDNPLENVVYEYSNLSLSLPVGFSVTNNPNSCSSVISNASNTKFGPVVTQCSYSGTLRQTQINFPRDDYYYLNVSAKKGDEKVYLLRQFGILISPNITIDSPPVQGCNVNLDFTTKVRKNPIASCIAQVYKDNSLQGQVECALCDSSICYFTLPFNDGIYRIDMTVKDNAIPANTGSDSNTFVVNSGCSGNSNNGGWPYPA